MSILKKDMFDSNQHIAVTIASTEVFILILFCFVVVLDLFQVAIKWILINKDKDFMWQTIPKNPLL